MSHFIPKLIFGAFCLSTFSVFGQNFIDKYLSDPLVYTTIASSTNGVLQPRDLDFKPNSNELWIVNHGTGIGGSNVIVYNAGLSNQTSEYRMDSHVGHFLLYPSALAFSEIGEWASTSEIQNSGGGPSNTFMGPALWSSDTAIFARVFQNNWQGGFPLGSHLDMLHQSPFAMGIASDSAKVYYVSDGWFGNLCRYDFVMDHGPGYDNHSAGKIWRYTDVPLSRAPGIPGHMVLDKNSRWLYIVNAGTKQLMRVNTNTGTETGNLVAPNEILSGYRAVTGATKQILETYSSQPCGIDYFNDRLIVGDYATGEIRVYNTSGTNPVLMGTIATGQSGMMGLKIGYDGKIWFVNNTLNTVVRIDPLITSNDASVNEIVSPSLINFEPNYHSPRFNVCSNVITPVVKIKNEGNNTITSCDLRYSVDGGPPNSFLWSGSLASNSVVVVSLPPMGVSDGERKLEVSTSNPNGSADNNTKNDKKEGSFRCREFLYSLPFSEDFSLPAFPPLAWSYTGFNKFCSMSRDASVGGYGMNDGCLKMDNSGGDVDITGQTDFFLSPRFDFTSSGAGTNLMFDVAYAQYSGSTSDKLEVKVSSDCGNTWTDIYNKAGTGLATAPPVTTYFTPLDSEWRTEVVSLDAFLGQELLILFNTTSNYGNNLFIDNININYIPGGVNAVSGNASSLMVYPNPANDEVMVSLRNGAILEIEVYTVLGTLVSEEVIRNYNQSSAKLNFSDLNSGTYLIKVKTKDGNLVKKVIVQH